MIIELASILINHEELERIMGIYQVFFDEVDFKYPQISKNERLIRATKKAAKKCISENMHKELIKFYVSESGLSLSVKDLEKIKIFVIAFNKEHEKNPIDIIDLINLKAERKKTKDFWDGAFRPDDYN
jgi:hypothetical protein